MDGTGLAMFDLIDSFGDIILDCAVKDKLSVASMIGTRLKVVAKPYRCFPSNPILCIDPDVEKASQALLANLLQICTASELSGLSWYKALTLVATTVVEPAANVDHTRERRPV